MFLQIENDAVIGSILDHFDAKIIDVLPIKEVAEINPATKDPKRDAFKDFFPCVPDELKLLPQWVCWRYVIKRKGEKPSKIPFQINGDYAKTNAPTTWTDYETVCNHRGEFDGIGFVFSDTDPLTGIDLDNCIMNGEIKKWAIPIIEAFKPVSYMEISPSKSGLKIWTQAKYHKTAPHKVHIKPHEDDAIECYDNARFFTVTGEGEGVIGNGQSVVDRVVDYMLRKKEKNSPNPRHVPNVPHVRKAIGKSATEVKELIQRSAQVYKFDALMAGNIKAYGSHSEADQALCSILAFWTQDASVIDTIFRESGLYRNKWDEKHKSDGSTYGEMTIERALSFNTTTYTAKKRHYKTATQRGRLSWL